jgi:queuine tRNA-ribosyltransferase
MIPASSWKNLRDVGYPTKQRQIHRLLATTVNNSHHPELPTTSSDFPPWAYATKDYFRFDVIHQSTKSLARVGRITTPHGIIDTPGFVAVGTNAALKAIDFPSADATGQQLIFSNTYHLLLHPGSDVIRDAGGIHKFTKRNSPFITDSGGFQVFSLKYGGVTESLASKGELKRAAIASGNRKKTYWRSDVMGKVRVTEDHVEFKSYRDGSSFILSPESSIQAQKDIGADVSSLHAEVTTSRFTVFAHLLAA